MSSNKENNNQTDNPEESSEHLKTGADVHGRDSDLESDMRYAVDAIDEAFDEHQEQIALKREQQLAETRAEQEMFQNMELQDDLQAEDGLPCLNCKTPLKGPYCYECGQPERHFIRFFPRVLWDMINEAFDLDSKIFRTLMPLMFRPGRLTMEYIAGRRASYINPLRMYIVISLVFFLVLELSESFSDDPLLNVASQERGVKSRVTISEDGVDVDEEKPESADELSTRQQQLMSRIEEVKQAKASGAPIPDSVIRDLEAELANDSTASGRTITTNEDDELSVTFDDGTEWHPTNNPIKFNGLFSTDTTLVLNEFLWQLKAKTKMVEEDPDGFVEEIFNVLPALMFILLPIFAVLLKIIYIFKKRYYMEHLIVALHSHSFIFFTLLMIFLVSALSGNFPEESWTEETLGLIFVLLWIWIPVNLFLQQKRVYAQGKFMTTVKFILVGISYMTLLGITAASAAVLGLVNL